MSSRTPLRSRFASLARSGALVLAALAISGIADSEAADWTWTLTPYAWATNVGVDVSIDDRTVVDETISVGDLVKDLDTTVQVHFEGQRGAQGMLFDVFDVRLSSDGRTVAVPNAPGVNAVLDSSMSMTLVEAAGLYDPRGDQEGFELLYGTRILDERGDIDARIELDPTAPLVRSYDAGDTYFDALIGARYVKRFTRRWSATLRADVSAGGTRFTWNASSTVAYAFGKRDRYAVTGGYRRMDVSFKADNSVQSDMSLSGFCAGFRVSF